MVTIMYSCKKAGMLFVVFLTTFTISEICASTTIDFDKNLVGLVFTPQTTSQNKEYNENAIESMLEMVSDKFQFIHPMGIGAFAGSHEEIRRHTDNMIPRCAARLNKKHGRLLIRVNLTIGQHGKSEKDEREMNEAAFAIKEANEIFNGTISSFKFKAYDNGNHILLPNLSKFLTKHFPHHLPYTIGVQWPECQYLSSFITGLNAKLRKTLHKLSYIVCDEYPLYKILANSTKGKDPIEYISDRVDEYNHILKVNNLSIATVISTGWPSKYSSEGKFMNSLNKMKSYWMGLDAFSKEKNQQLIMVTAFDTSDDFYGWWQKIGDDAFYEKLDDSLRIRYSTTTSRPIVSVENGASSNGLSFLYISETYLGIASLHMVITLLMGFL